MKSHLIDVGGIEALRVPLRIQPNTEQECLLYAMYMVLTYCETTHSNDKVREETVVLDPEELKRDYITIRDSGWSPTNDDLQALSDNLGIIDVSLRYWKRSPPIGTFEQVVKNGLSKDLPTIAIVDAMQIQNIDSQDGQHAIVVTGLGPSHIVVNDPWGSQQQRLKKDTVRDAWDTQLNRLVTFDTSKQITLDQGKQQEVTQS